MRGNDELSDRRETQILWIQRNRDFLWTHCAGQWIAVQGEEIVASGFDPDAVLDEALRKSFAEPLVTGVRKKEYQGVQMIPGFRVSRAASGPRGRLAHGSGGLALLRVGRIESSHEALQA